MMTDIDKAEVTQVQLQSDDQDDTIKNVIDFSEPAKQLANGLLAIYQPPLEQVKKDLKELIDKQESLLGQMQIENKKLQDVLEDIDLNEMFSTIKIYQGKLAMIKKEMIVIHDRTFKLKKRALRLQMTKQKEALNRKQQREQELRREQELIGKPTTSNEK